MNEEDQKILWKKAINTLASMCIADLCGKGSNKKTFISNLKLYTKYLENSLKEDEN